MLLFKDYNFAYLHINKTGGSSVKAFLKEVLGEDKAEVIGNQYNVVGDHPRVHETLYDKIEVLGPLFNTLNIVTTIRNPYARWVSLYSARRRNYREKGKTGNHILETLNRTFEEWLVERVINNINPNVLNFSLTRFLFVDNIIPSNVHMIKLEEVEAGIKNFLCRIGIETDETMPHENISNHGYFMDYYGDYTKELVYTYDKYIIDMFYPEFKYGG